MMQFLKQYEIEIITSIYTDNEILVKFNVRNKLIAIVNEKIANWCKT